ncbi:MAG: PEP-CTERM sorting domain-containing protein [Acidobacteria bacterium]|nr:PEP-CTERM sorting domain-containing protein [Acidobacteriota bacterium]
MTAPVVYSSNAFSLSPYSGLFDVDTNLASGGHNSNTPFNITSLSPGFNAASFQQLDSAGVLYAIVHLQQITCDSNGANCVQGSGSIKVGASSMVRPPDDPPGDDPTPEPATYAIVGLGLGAAYLIRKRG